MSSSLRRLLVGFFLFLARLTAPAEDTAELEAKLQDAIETGSWKLAAELAKPYRADTPLEGLSPRLCTLLGIVLRLDAPARASACFLAARKDEAEFMRASFWAGEVYLQRGYPGLAHGILAEMRRRDAAHRATEYLRARIALQAYVTDPPDDRRRRAAFARDVEAAISDYVLETLQRGRGFDPRFFTLPLDYAQATGNVSLAARAYVTLVAARPRNTPLLREALALHLADWPDNDVLRRTAEALLPPDELQRWRGRAARLAGLDLTRPADQSAWIAFVEEAVSKTPGAADLVPGRALLLQQVTEQVAAGWVPWIMAKAANAAGTPDVAPGNPAFPKLAQWFVNSAVRQRRTAPAILALRWSDLAAQVPGGQRPTRADELLLAALAEDNVRARPLLAAELPAHAGDFTWLSNYVVVVGDEDGPLRATMLEAMQRLQPAHPATLLWTARAAVYQPDGLAAYEKLFALAPLSGTRPRDWTDYRRLLQDAEARTAMLDGRKPGGAAETRFAATIERWQAGVTADVVLDEQWALVAIRRAAANLNLENARAGAKAARLALRHGSENPDITSAAATLAQAADKLAQREARKEEILAREREAEQARRELKASIRRHQLDRAKEEAEAEDYDAADEDNF